LLLRFKIKAVAPSGSKAIRSSHHTRAEEAAQSGDLPWILPTYPLDGEQLINPARHAVKVGSNAEKEAIREEG
jgi:hypothetical protein